MKTMPVSPINELPRDWSDVLFAALLAGEVDVLWTSVSSILLSALPDDLLIIWEAFDTTMYRQYDGVIVAEKSTSDAQALRCPQLYTVLNLGFEGRVRRFSQQRLMSCGLASHPRLSPYRPLEAVTVDFFQGNEVHAVLTLYGSIDDALERVALLERLRPALQQCITAIFRNRRQIAAGRGLSEFLRKVPAGLLLSDWFGNVLTVNDEGCRQALLWNEAPIRPSMKDARARFHVPTDITGGMNHLMSAWIDYLRDGCGPPSEHRVTHGLDPGLRATVSIVEDGGPSSATPCFMIRFSGFYARASETNISPTVRQVGLLASLSPAERSVAVLVQDGLTNKEIADRLGRQIGTVKDHLTSIYSKTGLTRRGQLMLALLD